MKIDFNKEDFGKIVKLEVDIDEISYIEKLLSYEIVFQVRGILNLKTTNDDKAIQVMSLFDTYRLLDDQLCDFMYAMHSQKDPNIKTDVKVKSVMVINKNVCKFYEILCTETTKLELPDEMSALMHKYNDQVLDKIRFAMDNDLDAKDLSNRKAVEKLFNHKTPDNAKEPSIKSKVNMFKVGLA